MAKSPCESDRLVWTDKITNTIDQDGSMSMSILKSLRLFWWSDKGDKTIQILKPSKPQNNKYIWRKRRKFWPKLSFFSIITLLLCILIGHNPIHGSPEPTAQQLQQQLQAPRFITQPSAAGSVVSEGRTKILQCTALGIPQPEYRWLKNGRFLGEFSSDHFYKIQGSKRDDAGHYQCIASNDAGKIYSEKISINVAFLTPFETQEEKTTVVRTGEAAVLELPPISSYPQPSVLWQARDNSLLYGSKFATTSDHKQVILDANSADQKAYRARATNTQLGQEETSGYINLLVTNPSDFIPDQIPPSIIIPPADSQIIKGQPEHEIQCIANARPLHDLETIWMKDGVPVETAGIPTSFNDLWNRTLILLKIDSQHAGEYTCHAKLRNSLFPVQSATAKIQVLEKPHFLTNLPTESYGEFGKEITMHCPVAGVPKPNITWYKDTTDIEGLPGYIIDKESNTLTIQYLKAQDSGMYQCWGVNAAGESNGYTWLRVKTSSPVMVKGPENRTVLEGNDVTLFCEVGGSPVPNVTWYRNETDAITPMGRFQFLETGSLLITAMRARDGGQYTCIRSNEAGTVIGNAFVSVLARTQIIQPPADTQIILGQIATLQCKVSSDPALPYEIEWEHNAEPILPGVSTRIRIHLDGTLEIREVRASDVGAYRCIVRSQGGSDERVAHLKIIELPYPPTNAKADKLPTLSPGANSKAVNISWSSGFDGNSQILKYIIQKRTVTQSETGIQIDLVNAGWETLLANVSSDSRSVIVEGLKPAASYQFRISSINSVGEGESSLPSNIVTLPQEPPTGPPTGLVGSARSPSQIIIQWHPPLEEHRNGQILGYIIRYRLHGYGDSNFHSIRNITNEAQRNYLIQDLITWKDYEIQISSYNNKGIGIYSQGIRIKTKEGIPGAPPTSVRVEALNSTCAQAYFNPPDPQQINGINQGYKIQAWQNEQNETLLKGTASVPPSPFDPLAEQTGVICALEKYTLYNITILCFTNPGDGKKSTPVSVKTLEDVPDLVRSLHFEEISDRSVKVVWSPPIKSNGILLGYIVRYGVKDVAASFKNMNFTSPNITSVKVTQLKASTYYSFEVCGYTKVGRGNCRSASMKSGVEPTLPQPPTNLAISNIQPFSVVVQFTPGFDGNSSITKWIVQAQTNRNSTWHDIFDYYEEPEVSSSNIISSGASAVFQQQQGQNELVVGNTAIISINNGNGYNGNIINSSPLVSNMESILVQGLKPFVNYKLRLIAYNVVGPSQPSQSSQQFQSLQSRPARPPRNVTVRAMSSNQLRVRWIPLQQSEWYGNPKGYNISYKQVGPYQPITYEIIGNPTGNSYVLKSLEEFTQYEIIMSAINDVGTSETSIPAIERTRESVPGVGPEEVSANATSSTTIVVKWISVPERHTNGIIEGYKIYYGAKNVPFQFKQIASNTTLSTTLTQLKKFTQYHIQVLAYTRVGDGVLSEPPALIQTWDDVPGPPNNISFPDVSTTMARMIWTVPADSNGVILAYRITYILDGSLTQIPFTTELSPETRTFRAIDLEREKYYWFTITAKTRLGWGESAKLLVFTTNNRELPQAPSIPRISPSQIQSNQITFSWTPGRDGFAPIRYYTVEYSENDSHWQRIKERIPPGGSSFTASDLKPYAPYKFRIQATNDIGSSGFSPESNITWTLPASPTGTVSDVQVVPITTTSVRVSWKAIAYLKWNGDSDTAGYKIEYRQVVDYPLALVQNTPKEEVYGALSTNIILADLSRDKNYEITVTPFNSRGYGGASRPVTVYVGEAVPTGEPMDVKVTEIYSTEIKLEWKPPLTSQQNGDLLGYKIFYKSIGSEEEELEVVPAWCVSHSLFFLEMYTNYSIRMVVFNVAGDGPASKSINLRTLQGPPGPVLNISFFDITMTSLRLTWEKPSKPNGEIANYLVTYETVIPANDIIGGTGSNEDHVISKQVRQKVSCCSLLVENLEEETSYTFSVRAKNSILNELGPAIWKNVTTGPQIGSPKSPKNLGLVKMFSAVQFRWSNGEKDKISGYYFEAKRKVAHEWQTYESRWQTVYKTDSGPLAEFTLSYQNLLPSTAYNFRIIAYNQFGISYPTSSDDTVHTPSKLYLEYGYLQQSPFYRQTWFLVMIASVSIIFIIALIAYLFVKTKSYNYKHDSERSLAETASIEEGVLYGSSVELRQSQKKISTLKRKPGPAPPRPTPGSITYTDDESDKAYDNNPDESSLTEKPSEISSTDSQGSETEVEDEVDGSVGKHSFVNHYANVNDTLKQSWQKQKPVRSVPPPVPIIPPIQLQHQHQQNMMNNYSSYTDSEPEATASLSGQGRIVLNNMARSRAPLPGFSSFI